MAETSISAPRGTPDLGIIICTPDFSNEEDQVEAGVPKTKTKCQRSLGLAPSQGIFLALVPIPITLQETKGCTNGFFTLAESN